jgi:hypothetical protein
LAFSFCSEALIPAKGKTRIKTLIQPPRVRDATKDFPDVNATVDNGVITLTGSIERSRYPTLKQSLDALRPKQVVNNLNYK